MAEHGSFTQRTVGRYLLFDEIASGGMATVHLGRMLGPAGFNKTVAIKRLHGNLAKDPEFVSMFLDEARLAARIQHPNVVATLDVVPADGEVFLVLDYVQGESLSHLLKAARLRGERAHPRVIASILVNALHGLHAAHEARDEHDRPLGIVHRDVSPQNILVGTDGVARVLDFGVAKAAGRLQSTRDGQLKGKIAYMAPEQITGATIDRKTDVYAAAVVLWEGLSGQRLVHGLNEGQVLAAILAGNFPAPSSVAPDLAPYDAVVMRGLEKDPARRYPTAREMAIVIERQIGLASAFEIAEWVQSVGAETLALRAARVREMESTSAVRVALDDGSSPRVYRTDHSTDRLYERSQSGVLETSIATTAAPLAAPPPLPNPFVQGAAPPIHAPAPRVAASPAPAGRLKLVLFSVAVSAVFGLSMIALLLFLRTRPAAAPEEGVAAETPTVATQQPAAPPEPEASAHPVLDMPPVAVTAEDERPAPPPSATAAPAARTTATAATAKNPGPAPQPKKPPAKCDQPFYVDSAGIKQIKPECM